MKKFFIIIALLSAIILISPNFIGGVVETEYQSALNKLNDNPAITIKSTTFNRNWFSGKVVTEMTILLQHEEIEELNIITEDDISFGPVVFTDEGIKLALSYSKSSINFADFVIEEEVEDFIKNKIHLSVLLTFSKDIITHITVDEVRKAVDGNNILSAKAVGKFVLENDSRLYGDFNWDGLSVKTNDESFIVGDVKLSLDQTLITGNYYQGNAVSTGDFNFSMFSVETKDATGHSTFSLENLLINATSSVKNDLMKIKMNYSVDTLASAGQTLKHANLDVILNGVSITVMQEINTLLTNLSNNSEEVFSSDDMNQLSVLTAKILANDPNIEIKDFSVETPEGKIESAIQVSVDKKLFDTANLMSIIPAINATAKSKAPVAFFNKLGLTAMVEEYVQQGLIIQKDGELTLNVKFSQGQLNINGNRIPL